MGNTVKYGVAVDVKLMGMTVKQLEELRNLLSSMTKGKNSINIDSKSIDALNNTILNLDKMIKGEKVDFGESSAKATSEMLNGIINQAKDAKDVVNLITQELAKISNGNESIGSDVLRPLVEALEKSLGTIGEFNNKLNIGDQINSESLENLYELLGNIKSSIDAIKESFDGLANEDGKFNGLINSISNISDMLTNAFSIKDKDIKDSFDGIFTMMNENINKLRNHAEAIRDQGKEIQVNFGVMNDTADSNKASRFAQKKLEERLSAYKNIGDYLGDLGIGRKYFKDDGYFGTRYEDVSDKSAEDAIASYENRLRDLIKEYNAKYKTQFAKWEDVAKNYIEKNPFARNIKTEKETISSLSKEARNSQTRLREAEKKRETETAKSFLENKNLNFDGNLSSEAFDRISQSVDNLIKSLSILTENFESFVNVYKSVNNISDDVIGKTLKDISIVNDSDFTGDIQDAIKNEIESETIKASVKVETNLEESADTTASSIEIEGKSADEQSSNFNNLTEAKLAALRANQELAKSANETAPAIGKEGEAAKNAANDIKNSVIEKENADVQKRVAADNKTKERIAKQLSDLNVEYQKRSTQFDAGDSTKIKEYAQEVSAYIQKLNEYKAAKEDLIRMQNSDPGTIDQNALESQRVQVDQLNSELKKMESNLKSIHFDSTNKNGKLLDIDVNDIVNADDKLEELKKKLQEIMQIGNGENLQVFSNGKSGNNFIAEVDDGTNNIRQYSIALDKMNGQIRSIDMGAVPRAMSETGKSVGQLKTGFKGLGESIAEYAARAFSFYQIVGFFKEAINVTREYNDSLSTISMTMDITTNQLNKLGDSVVKTAKDMSTSISDTMNIAKIYANMQSSPEEIMELTKPTLMLANASGLDSTTSSDYIQSIMNQFQMTENESEHIVDALETISANIKMDFAKGIDTIAQGVETAGSVAYEAGFSMETFSAIIAKTAEVTRQSGSSIANSWKTILTRISKASGVAKDEIDPETLSNASKSLAKVGIQVYDTKGEFNDIDNILGELYQKWDGLSDALQSEIAFNVAATRNTNAFKVALTSYAEAMGLAEDATNAFGVAQKNQAIYEETYAAKITNLQNSIKDIQLTLLNSDWFKGLIDGAQTFLELINSILDVLGPLGALVVGIAGAKGLDVFGSLLAGPGGENKLGGFWNSIKGIGKSVADGFGVIKDSVSTGMEFSQIGGIGLGFDGFKLALEASAAEGSKLASILSALLVPELGITVAVLTAAAGAALYFANNQKKLIEQGKKGAQNWENQKKSVDDYKEKYIELNNQLKEAQENNNETKSLQIKEQLYDLQKQITDEYGETVDGIDLVNGNLNEQLIILRNITAEYANQDVQKNKSAYKKAEKMMTEKNDYSILGPDNVSFVEDIFEANGFSRHSGSWQLHDVTAAQADEYINNLILELQKRKSDLKDEAQKLLVDSFISSAQESLSNATSIIDDYGQAYSTYLQEQLFGEYTEGESKKNGYEVLSEAKTAIDEYNDALLSGNTSKINEAYAKIQNVNELVQQINVDGKYDYIFNGLFDGIDKDTEKLINFKNIINGTVQVGEGYSVSSRNKIQRLSKQISIRELSGEEAEEEMLGNQSGILYGLARLSNMDVSNGAGIKNFINYLADLGVVTSHISEEADSATESYGNLSDAIENMDPDKQIDADKEAIKLFDEAIGQLLEDGKLEYETQYNLQLKYPGVDISVEGLQNAKEEYSEKIRSFYQGVADDYYKQASEYAKNGNISDAIKYFDLSQQAGRLGQLTYNQNIGTITSIKDLFNGDYGKAIDSITNKYKTFIDAQTEFQKNGKLSDDTLKQIITDVPELYPYLNDLETGFSSVSGVIQDEFGQAIENARNKLIESGQNDLVPAFDLWADNIRNSLGKITFSSDDYKGVSESAEVSKAIGEFNDDLSLIKETQDAIYNNRIDGSQLDKLFKRFPQLEKYKRNTTALKNELKNMYETVGYGENELFDILSGITVGNGYSKEQAQAALQIHRTYTDILNDQKNLSFESTLRNNEAALSHYESKISSVQAAQKELGTGTKKLSAETIKSMSDAGYSAAQILSGMENGYDSMTAITSAQFKTWALEQVDTMGGLTSANGKLWWDYINQIEEGLEELEGYKLDLGDVIDLSTPLYGDWVAAQASANPKDRYESIVSGRENMEKLFTQGWYWQDDFRTYAQLLGDNDDSTADAVNNFKENNEKWKKYFTEDSSGTIKFFEMASEKAQDLVKYTSDGVLDFSGLNDGTRSLKEFADEIGITTEMLVYMLQSAKDIGYNITFDFAAENFKNSLDEIDAEQANAAARTQSVISDMIRYASSGEDGAFETFSSNYLNIQNKLRELWSQGDVEAVKAISEELNEFGKFNGFTVDTFGNFHWTKEPEQIIEETQNTFEGAELEVKGKLVVDQNGNTVRDFGDATQEEINAYNSMYQKLSENDEQFKEQRITAQQAINKAIEEGFDVGQIDFQDGQWSAAEAEVENFLKALGITADNTENYNEVAQAMVKVLEDQAQATKELNDEQERSNQLTNNDFQPNDRINQNKQTQQGIQPGFYTAQEEQRKAEAAQRQSAITTTISSASTQELAQLTQMSDQEISIKVGYELDQAEAAQVRQEAEAALGSDGIEMVVALDASTIEQLNTNKGEGSITYKPEHEEVEKYQNSDHKGDGKIIFQPSSEAVDLYIAGNPRGTGYIDFKPATSSVSDYLDSLNNIERTIKFKVKQEGTIPGSVPATGTMFVSRKAAPIVAHNDGTIGNRSVVRDGIWFDLQDGEHPQKNDIVFNERDTAKLRQGKSLSGFGGHAYANGTDVTLKHDEYALVNEQGNEGLLRNGKLREIKGGTHFEHLKKGDAIINAAQWSAIKQYGTLSSYTGNAYAKGTVTNVGTIDVNSGYKDNNGLNIGQLNKDSGITNALNANTEATKAQTEAAKDNSKDTKDNTNSQKKSSTTLEKFQAWAGKLKDWIEVRLDRIQRSIDLNTAKSENATTYQTKNAPLNANLTQTRSLISNNEAGSKRYQIQADRVESKATKVSVKKNKKGKKTKKLDFGANLLLSEKEIKSYKKRAKAAKSVADVQKIANEATKKSDKYAQDLIDKIKTGEIDIQSLTEKQKQFVETYSEWFDRSQDCIQSAEELKKQLKEIAQTKLDNITEEFESWFQLWDDFNTSMENGIEYFGELGYQNTSAFYEAQIANSDGLLKKRYAEREAYAKEMEQAAKEFGIDSNEYRNAEHNLFAIDHEIQQIITNQEKWNNAIRQLSWDKFDQGTEAIKRINEEADVFTDLMSDEKMFDEDTGKITEYGKATQGLNVQGYETSKQLSKRAQEAYEAQLKVVEADPQDNAERERLKELETQMWDAAKATKEYRDRIKDLVKQGIEAELNALQKVIDKYKQSLKTQREEADYAKTIGEKTSNITTLRKQLAAYSTNTSEEGMAKRASLSQQLKEAENDLQETETDKMLNGTEAILDNLYTEYETNLNERLDNIDQLIEDETKTVDANQKEIKTTLDGVSDKFNVTMSDAMTSIWSGENGTNAATSVASGVSTAISGVKNLIEKIWSKMDSQDIVDSVTQQHENADAGKPTLNDQKPSQGGGGGSNGGTTTTIPSKEAQEQDALSNAKAMTLIDAITYTLKSGTKHSGKITAAEKKEHNSLWEYIVKNWGVAPSYSQYAVLASALGLKSIAGKGKKMTSDDKHKILNYLREYINYYGISVKNGKVTRKGYASGAYKLNKDELAWTQENGMEAIIRRSDGAILTPLNRGDSILTAQETERLIEFAKNGNLMQNMSSGLHIPSGNINSNSANNYGQTVNVSFALPNVYNYADFVREAQNDPKFEKLVQNMTLGRMMGQSKLSKNQIKF